MLRSLTSMVVLAVTAYSVSAHAVSTLEAVKARGTLRCGTMNDTPGFGSPDANNQLRGMEVDYCRVMAAAVLGDAKKVSFVPLTTQNRFPALQSGEVDVLFRETTVTFSRDTSLGFLSGPPTVYDGQGLMVPASLGIKKVKDLDGASVCVVPGTNSELNISNFFTSQGMKYKPVSIESIDEMRRAFFAGRCDVFSSDRTFLASVRSVAKKPDSYVILPTVIAKSPLAPMVRQGDDQWYNILRWVVYAPMMAEEFGVTKANVDTIRSTTVDPVIKRFLGSEAGFSKGLGLKDDWAYQIVKQVGNYGELYESDLGMKSPLKLERGTNRLAKDGGLLYVPPFI